MKPLTLFLYVQPGAKTSGWSGLHDGRLKIRLAAPAVDGKANTALLAFLATALDVKKKQLTLVTGEKSRLKQVRIDNPGDRCIQIIQQRQAEKGA